jgi:hypothetical protein
MTDKLITIQYASVDTNVTVQPVVAKSELYDANIKVNVTGAEESSIPTPGKFKRALDNFLAAESSRKTISIPALSNIIISDRFATRAQFRRVPVELVDTSDQKSVFAAKNTNTAFISRDTPAKFTSTVHANLVTNTSSVNKLISLPKDSLVNFSDYWTLETFKVILEPFPATDLLNRVVDYNRTFTDLVDITDDYYGLSNIDDDQYAYFDKRLTSVLFATQLLSPPLLTIGKLVTNSIKASQTRRSLTRLGKLEQVNPQDFSRRRARKNNVERVVEIDVVYKDYSKPLKDLKSVSDTRPPKTLQKSQLDTVNSAIQDVLNTETAFVRDFHNYLYTNSVADLVLKLFSIKAVSGVTHSEIIDILRGTFFFETVSTNTDSISNYINKPLFSNTNSTLDLATLASNLGLVNSTSFVQDLIDILRFTSFSVTSPVSAIDIGYANNQNYFSEAYVEPGYVGTNSYFS